MLALLLALSPGAVAMQASAPVGPASAQTRGDAVHLAQSGTDTVGPESDRNTTTVMTLGTAPSRTALDSPSLALGNSLAMNRDGFRTQLSINSLDRQLENADSAEKKKQVLNRYRYRIENRIISLKATEQQATQAFLNGTISEGEYLRTLGQIDAEAGEIRRAVNALKERAESANFGVDANSLKIKLVTVEGPVRDRIAKTLQGRANPARIYVETADSGVVLSSIVDGTYIRETFRSDNRDPSKRKSISVQNAITEVIQPQYPWVSNPNNWTGSSRRVYSPIQSIKYTYDYSHGSLTAYVDTGTAKVYREIQHKELTGEPSLPPGPTVANSSENVTVTVNRTYPGGPLRVRLTNATGAPLRGEVTVAGERVGRTGPNGELWTLGPAEQFRVSATYDDTTVNVTATPVNSSRKD